MHPDIKKTKATDIPTFRYSRNFYIKTRQLNELKMLFQLGRSILSHGGQQRNLADFIGVKKSLTTFPKAVFVWLTGTLTDFIT